MRSFHVGGSLGLGGKNAGVRHQGVRMLGQGPLPLQQCAAEGLPGTWEGLALPVARDSVC